MSIEIPWGDRKIAALLKSDSETSQALTEVLVDVGAGVVGPMGPQGEPGPQGLQGPVGPAGADGIDGIDGTDGVDGTTPDISGKQDINTTLNANPGTASLRSLNLNYAANSSNPDTFSVFIQGVLKLWHNEWGALRGTSPYTWGDALIRAIRSTGDGITAGNFIELQDRRSGSSIMYGRRWVDGALVRNGITMADCVVLGASDPVPAGLPAGTIIYRTA